MRSLLRKPFVSALAGGLVVAGSAWVAIAAGWIAGEKDAAAGPAASAAPALTPAADEGGGAGPTVNAVYERAAPGVAAIRAERAAPASRPSPFGPAPPRGGVSSGSGFVIDEEGRILTNAHVVHGSSDISVTFGEAKDVYDAELLGEDSSTDVAVIRVEAPAEALEPLPLGDSSRTEVGDPVIAIGNPFGLDRTATAGIVSAVQREIPAPNGFVIREAIQTDAPINPGNSGGPLLDASGRVIGINSQIESPGGGGNVGIGFAVPIDTAREIAQELIEDGEVEHAFLGVSGADLTPEIASVLNLAVAQGAIVQAVVPDSPADRAGLESGDARVSTDGLEVRAGGDVIVAVGGDPVGSMGDVIAAVDERRPGDELELSVLRAGERRDVTVELAERPAAGRP